MASAPVRVIVLGPPGAGKSTQSGLLARCLGVPAVPTCDVFRSSIVRRTDLGIRARTFTDADGFLPDHLTNAMVRTRLAELDSASGFVLDGYPQNLHQVEELDDILDGRQVHSVFVLAVRFRELVDRLVRRAEAEGATDGAPESVTSRQEQFAEHTSQVLAEYSRRGLLRVVDGSGTLAEVTARLTNNVGSALAT